MIRDLGLRAEGLARNLSQVSTAGIQQADIDAGQALIDKLEQLDVEQEVLKAKTAAQKSEVIWVKAVSDLKRPAGYAIVSLRKTARLLQ